MRKSLVTFVWLVWPVLPSFLLRSTSQKHHFTFDIVHASSRNPKPQAWQKSWPVAPTFLPYTTLTHHISVQNVSWVGFEETLHVPGVLPWVVVVLKCGCDTQNLCSGALLCFQRYFLYTSLEELKLLWSDWGFCIEFCSLSSSTIQRSIFALEPSYSDEAAVSTALVYEVVQQVLHGFLQYLLYCFLSWKTTACRICTRSSGQLESASLVVQNYSFVRQLVKITECAEDTGAVFTSRSILSLSWEMYKFLNEMGNEERKCLPAVQCRISPPLGSNGSVTSWIWS